MDMFLDDVNVQIFLVHVFMFGLRISFIVFVTRVNNVKTLCFSSHFYWHIIAPSLYNVTVYVFLLSFNEFVFE